MRRGDRGEGADEGRGAGRPGIVLGLRPEPADDALRITRSIGDLLAAVFAVGASQVLKPVFALPIVMPAIAFVVLPVIAVLVGLLSSLVALRRAIAVDPSSAFAAAS